MSEKRYPMWFLIAAPAGYSAVHFLHSVWNQDAPMAAAWGSAAVAWSMLLWIRWGGGAR